MNQNLYYRPPSLQLADTSVMTERKSARKPVENQFDDAKLNFEFRPS